LDYAGSPRDLGSGPNSINNLVSNGTIATALQPYASIVTEFFRPDIVFKHSLPISVVAYFEDINPRILIYNNTSGHGPQNGNWSNPLWNNSIHPSAPDESCSDLAPMVVKQLPLLLGLQEDPKFCSVLAAIFMVWYWVALADFGRLSSGRLSEDDNIFVNETLFELYNTFLNDVALSYTLPNTSSNYGLNPFPFNETNPQLSPMPLAVGPYICSQRRIKVGLNLLISVAAADTALILGAYNLFIFLASRIQKRRNRKRKRKEKLAAEAVNLVPCNMNVSDTHTPTDLEAPSHSIERDELPAMHEDNEETTEHGGDVTLYLEENASPAFASQHPSLSETWGSAD